MALAKRKRDPAKNKAYVKRYRAARRAAGKPPPLCFVVQTDEETMAAVLARVKQSGFSMSELIRTYIEWGLENDGGQIV